jgi:hypothetical protein
MSVLVAFVLLFLSVLFLLVVLTLLRLTWGDSNAVEIDLREIEGWD